MKKAPISLIAFLMTGCCCPPLEYDKCSSITAEVLEDTQTVEKIGYGDCYWYYFDNLINLKIKEVETSFFDKGNGCHFVKVGQNIMIGALVNNPQKLSKGQHIKLQATRSVWIQLREEENPIIEYDYSNGRNWSPKACNFY